MTDIPPLAIKEVMIGSTATRYLFNDGRTYVAETNKGLCCLNSMCIRERIANECKHVAMVEAYGRAHRAKASA